MEDNLLRLGRRLSELFAFIYREVKLKHTLIVLSADHGGPEALGYLRELNQDASYVDPSAFTVDSLNATLRIAVGTYEDLVQTYFNPYVCLDHDKVIAAGLDLTTTQRSLAAALMKSPVVAQAFTADDIKIDLVPDNPIASMIAGNHHPKRSGDVYVVFSPQSFINDFDGLEVAASHGSVWRYD